VVGAEIDLYIQVDTPSLSSPGSTGRSSKHRPGVLDCPVKPGNDIDTVSASESALAAENISSGQAS
jgi:hypothetical protein